LMRMQRTQGALRVRTESTLCEVFENFVASGGKMYYNSNM
jgi:hypothetical protein